MSKQRKTASAMSVCQYLAAGVTGTAMVGLGVLLTVPPDKPAPTTAEVKLATTEAECVPDTPGCDSAALGASLGVDSFATVGTTAIFFGAIGSGGWLIGDGLSAAEIDATCTGRLQRWQRRALWGLRRRRRLRRHRRQRRFLLG